MGKGGGNGCSGCKRGTRRHCCWRLSEAVAVAARVAARVAPEAARTRKNAWIVITGTSVVVGGGNAGIVVVVIAVMTVTPLNDTIAIAIAARSTYTLKGESIHFSLKRLRRDSARFGADRPSVSVDHRRGVHGPWLRRWTS